MRGRCAGFSVVAGVMLLACGSGGGHGPGVAADVDAGEVPDVDASDDVPADAARLADAAVMVDAARPGDAALPPDGARIADAAVPADAAIGPDAARPIDAAVPDAAVVSIGVKRVFATAAVYTGEEVAGIVGADAKCQSAADLTTAAGLADLGGSHWKAWISDATTDAASRIADVGPWYLVDRTTRVFRNKAHILLNPAALDHVINQSERGTTIYGESWTGTLPGGSRAPYHCLSWSQSSASGMVGEPSGTDNRWTAYTERWCTEPQHLICFEQP